MRRLLCCAIAAVGLSPAAAVAAPHELYAPGQAAHYAFLNRPTTVYATASGSGRVVGKLTLRTQDGTDELVGVLSERVVKGRDWVRVQLPLRPTGSTGWVPRDALGEIRATDLWLKVDRRARRAKLIRAGKVIWTARVGIGMPGAPTPAGRFYIRDRIVPRNAGGIYGPVAFGTSARSRTLTDWPGGGFIGIHGTNEPGLIPGRISHGCVRVRNDAIRRLDKLLHVGTPVTIT